MERTETITKKRSEKREMEKMEKICGTCSQEKGLSKGERMEIAKSRIPNQIYHCSICNKEHSYKALSYKLPQLATPITANQVSKTTVIIKNNKGKKSSKPEQFQLDLF